MSRFRPLLIGGLGLVLTVSGGAVAAGRTPSAASEPGGRQARGVPVMFGW